MSNIRANTIGDTAGTGPITLTKQSAAKTWVNFNGATSTDPASMTGVRGSFNVSSILDNGTGLYTVNFSQNMANVNYSVSITTGESNAMTITNRACCVSSTLASSVSGSFYTATGGARIDMPCNSFIIHGDLA